MAEPNENPVAISEGELDLSVIEAEDRFLTVKVVYRTLDADGEAADFVDSTTERFGIRGSLPVPTMTAFLRLEARINEALAADDTESGKLLESTMDEAHRRIVGLIVEKNPRAFRDREIEIDGEKVKVQPAIELDVSQILVLLAWIAGDTSIADAVTKALTAGRSQKALRADEIAAVREMAAGGDAEAAETGPLASSGP